MISEASIAAPKQLLRFRALVSLPQKKRCKSDPAMEPENVAPGKVLVPAISPLPRRQRLKRSGHPHHQWKAQPSAVVTKLGFSETISDGIERFVSHLHVAQAR
jgi:hypothetical protein